MGQALEAVNRYSKLEVDNGVDFICYIYPNKEDCYIRVLSKSKHQYKGYNINSIKEPNKLRQIVNKHGREDLFFNLNTFRTMGNMTRDNLFAINCIGVDVDYKRIKGLKDLTPMQVIKQLEMDYFDIKIPMPNIVEYGNQIRLIYRLKDTVYIPKYSDKVTTLCRRISEEFAKVLNDYGAEKQNLESYFRFPKSINTKTDDKVEMFYYENAFEYELNELQELWLEELPKWYKKKKGKRRATKQIYKLHNVYTLNTGRLNDFERIQEHLNQNKITDYRARLCFLYRDYFLILREYQNGGLSKQDFVDAEEALYKFNSKFNYPLRERAIESATRVVKYRRYLYKNETLVDFLGLDWALCEELGLESIYKPKTKQERDKDYHTKHKSKRNEGKKQKYENKLKLEGKMTEKEMLSQRRKKIKDLLDKGLKQKAICEKLEISKDTYIRDRKYLKEQGLL